MEEMKKNNSLMAGKGEGGKWITVKGSHIFVEDGQSVEDAMNKHFNKSGDTKTAISSPSDTDNAKKIIREEMLSYFPSQKVGREDNFDAMSACISQDKRFKYLSDVGMINSLMENGFITSDHNKQRDVLSKIYGKEKISDWGDIRVSETYKMLLAREYKSILRERNAKAVGFDKVPNKNFDSKQELIDFIKHQTNIELKDDKAERLNNQNDVLYARLPGHSDNNTILSLLDTYGIRHEEHLNNGYWIWLKNSN